MQDVGVLKIEKVEVVFLGYWRSSEGVLDKLERNVEETENCWRGVEVMLEKRLKCAGATLMRC